MRELNFYKFQGTGNDFIIIDQVDETFDLTTDQISQLCHRRFGIGADGFIILRASLKADFKMVYFNSDGNESTMCGNGGRCIGRLCHQLFPAKGRKFKLQAIDGIHNVEIMDEELVALQMNDVLSIEESENQVVLNTGSPHYVTFRNDIFNLDVQKEGSQIRNSEKYAKQGINVNFVDMQDDFIAVRTYERGVEAETLSCGTGVTAAAISADLCSRGKYGDSITVHSRGGTLDVRFEKVENSYKNIWLVGPAIKVFEGKVDLK